MARTTIIVITNKVRHKIFRYDIFSGKKYGSKLNHAQADNNGIKSKELNDCAV